MDRLWWKLIALQSKRLVLVPYLRDHVARYHSWMKDPVLRELTGSEPLELHQEYEMQQSWSSDPNKCTFIILDKRQMEGAFSPPAPYAEAMIGDVNLYMNDVDDPNAGEIEVMIAETDRRGQGFGKEATKMMLAFAFNYLGIKTFRAKILESNEPSLQLFRNLSFKETVHSSVFKQVTMELTPDLLPEGFDIVEGY